MALLNKDEFQKLTGIVPDADFDKLEKAAEKV